MSALALQFPVLLSAWHLTNGGRDSRERYTHTVMAQPCTAYSKSKPFPSVAAAASDHRSIEGDDGKFTQGHTPSESERPTQSVPARAAAELNNMMKIPESKCCFSPGPFLSTERTRTG